MKATGEVKPHVVTADLDIEGIDGPDQETKEDDPGGFLAFGGARRKILLEATPNTAGPVKLEVTSGGDKAGVYRYAGACLCT